MHLPFTTALGQQAWVPPSVFQTWALGQQKLLGAIAVCPAGQLEFEQLLPTATSEVCEQHWPLIQSSEGGQPRTGGGRPPGGLPPGGFPPGGVPPGGVPPGGLFDGGLPPGGLLTGGWPVPTALAGV